MYRGYARSNHRVMLNAAQFDAYTMEQGESNCNLLDWRRRFDLTVDILLLVIFVILCYVNGTFCLSANKTSRGTKDMQTVLNLPQQPGHCDLDKSCDWAWDKAYGFKKVIAPITGNNGPTMDASQSEKGYFLWYGDKGNVQTWSSKIPRTGSRCELEVYLYQVGMDEGIIRLVIVTNETSSVAATRQGNDNETWEITRFKLGAISQPHQLLLEMVIPHENASIAIDNIRLIECFPELTPVGIACTDDMFRCHNGSCLNKTRVCDMTKDCAEGEDEEADCHKIPENARCNFEDGWCGWQNVPGSSLNWTLNQGPTPSEKTGPSYDHTYRNVSGTYAYVNMFKRVGYGSKAIIESPLYNPTPPYSSDSKSRYYRSCQVRFFFHQYGVHSGALGLYLIVLKPYQNYSNQLWWSYGDRSDVWYDQAVPLPDIRYRYFLQFEASRGISSKGDVAIDDFSLSRECFGIGVPREVVGNFNYYSPFIESDRIPDQHADFMNETVIRVTTCGATGRAGPTPDQCAEEYNATDIELVVEDSSPNLNGVQRWAAPRGGYYTIIAMGAAGGQGSSGMGSTLGSLVRGVIELEKGEPLYFMVGQRGVDACPKTVGEKLKSCQSDEEPDLQSIETSLIREVMKYQIKDGGGGGGGATYVFKLKRNGDQLPLLVAGGGGGLGLGVFVDTKLQHGRGIAPFAKPPISNAIFSTKAGGPGGGWNGSSSSDLGQRTTTGMPLVRGGLGGIGCGPGNRSHGDGGFGGGGGGCLSGGGGGGYIGGDTSHKDSGNGEGGYSYANEGLMHVSYQPAINHGPGEVYIIPDISGCGCDFRCVALDRYLSEIKCLCPPGWLLSNDSRSCVMAEDLKGTRQTFLVLLIAVSVVLFCAFAALCILLYNRYQSRKALVRRRQVMFGNGTELTSLRAVSDTMMTEFNPNYEFAGSLYSFKDLPQIPREYIILVKLLGQGAFGEVYEGVCKYGRGQEHRIAVKTIARSSAPQTEAEFMMEALIVSKFDHPNIVRFVGVSYDRSPKYLILELLIGGNLKNFLREERPRRERTTGLTMSDLIRCAYDVASGCKYMEEARFIHRDIAARNCLLTCKEPGRVVKIADFGMAKDIYRSDYYRKGGRAMLPIKWMPPESFLDGIFTTKTDVWAYGVLMWEIMTFGYVPYTGCTNRQTMTMVTSGTRLQKPAGCPDPIFALMKQCWQAAPEDRPSFATISERLGYCLQDPDVINLPTPTYDLLPVCANEVMIMRPHPNTECINVQSELDACGYMKPRIIDPGSARRHLAQAAASIPLHRRKKIPVKTEASGRRFMPPTEFQWRFRYRKYGHNARVSMRTFDGNMSLNENDEIDENEENEGNDDTESKPNADSTNLDESSIHRTSTDIENSDKVRVADNDNNRPGDAENREDSIVDATDDAAKRNGNESVTSTDTTSGSLIVALASPLHTTHSSPNTRTSSPIHTGLTDTATNVNEVLKKRTLKAALSLDSSVLRRDMVPYDKIGFSPLPQMSSMPGSMELRKVTPEIVEPKKDSLDHDLSENEDSSC